MVVISELYISLLQAGRQSFYICGDVITNKVTGIAIQAVQIDALYATH